MVDSGSNSFNKAPVGVQVNGFLVLQQTEASHERVPIDDELRQ